MRVRARRKLMDPLAGCRGKWTLEVGGAHRSCRLVLPRPSSSSPEPAHPPITRWSGQRCPPTRGPQASQDTSLTPPSLFSPIPPPPTTLKSLHPRAAFRCRPHRSANGSLLWLQEGQNMFPEDGDMLSAHCVPGIVLSI